MSKVIFEAQNASKVIEGLKILEGIDINLTNGEVVAITGQNGSGKSSLLKLIAGIYEPSSGKVIRSPKRISYVPEHFPENIRFKMNEYLLLLGEMSGRKKEELSIEMTYWAHAFGIEGYLDTPLKKLSKGTKQKVGVIQSLLMKADVILLDEPLSGLDEVSQHVLINQIQQIKKEKTIIFTSHEAFLVETIANRKIELSNGRIIANERVVKRELIRVIRSRVPSKQGIEKITGVIDCQIENDSVAVITVKEKDSDLVLKELLLKNASILEVREEWL
ncbi:ATP-binding cassette domain-containing protein [Bacillus massilinigeriensis]|uniref:ATP-binding cassette domain-containing protein n=1 Tax=Bacillus massilionigeriensis TaxID=1805475 RepID=UPI00096AE3EE|nr:ABC transporter ATP-binding protein [Bacillus massilionigeriensis]